jgi:fumarylacetoacetate (FAA) hydrolase
MRLGTFVTPGGEPRVGELAGGVVRELRAPTMVDWLAGDGHQLAGPEHPMEQVRWLAPVPEPPSVRDFFCFEEHVRAAFALRQQDIPQAWYETPVFYFSNPASIVGPDDSVAKPGDTGLLDVELEIAAVVGSEGIAGFTLLADWSARDLQGREMTVGLGPAKGKDFATGLGPWLVTPDELPLTDGRLDLEATLSVNGVELARSRAAEQRWRWDELVAHAARNTPGLRPGDVLGSGTLNGGCLLELGGLPTEVARAEEPRFLEPGDEVVLACEPLGELRGVVA